MRTQPAALPQGEAKVQAVRNMFDAIAPRYDLINRIMTFGLDNSWRRKTVSALGLVSGSIVADLACGTGDLCRVLADVGMRPIGLDMSFGMLAQSKTNAARTQADALRLPLGPASVDGAISGFALRNFMALPPVFGEMARIVRPGGRIALLDVAIPSNALLRFGHATYFGQVVPRLGALLSDASAYAYLPRSVAYLPTPAELVNQLEQTGFDHVEHRLLTGGVTQLITATRS